MSRLTSQQRKLVYLAGIVVLLIPAIMLGMPNTGAENSGGKLAELRQTYRLGESTLGDVDPTSAAMNLVLLGLRGVAANLLWMEHDEQKRTKNWAEMRATAESIIMLQPHYLKVWRYHGWDLAYNTSAEWDAVADRWYWVKEGAKFSMKGARRNDRYPDLFWEVGRILGQKIGRADEWRFFRQYFKSDPNVEKFGGGPDPEIATRHGREFNDNYLAAKAWYFDANKVEDTQDQHIMMRMLFRQYPARSQLDYAHALQREGYFDEKTRVAWNRAFEDWTTRYENNEKGFGQEEFESPGGTIILEATPQAVQALAKKDNVKEMVKWTWIDRYQKIANYPYWRTRALSEGESNTVEAHREIHEGKQLYQSSQFYPLKYQPVQGACDNLSDPSLSEPQRTVLTALCNAGQPLTFHELAQQESVRAAFSPDQTANLLKSLTALVEAQRVHRNLSPAQARLESGMKRFQQLLDKYPELKSESNTVEEALLAFLYWRNIHVLNNDPMPEDFPLHNLVTEHQKRLPEIEQEFQRENELR